MSHPHYQLRPNKAVERFLFLELLTHLDRNAGLNISKHIYHGFGGPFMEDFRILHLAFPEMGLRSIEREPETHKRQKFHSPCAKIKYFRKSSSEYLDTVFRPSKNGDIFWLDYTGRKPAYFREFQEVLGKVGKHSIVKITLNVRAFSEADRELGEKKEKFRKDLGEYLPADFRDADFRKGQFPYLVVKMLKIASQGIFQAYPNLYFQILSAFVYADAEPILTVAGVVLETKEEQDFLQKTRGWKYENLDWSKPITIEMPVLSIKERLALEKQLPCKRDSINNLDLLLGYRIASTQQETNNQLLQYSEFYRFYPYFSKILV